jgi:RNA polymerase sigma-70 factor (ECF subfamily)
VTHPDHSEKAVESFDSARPSLARVAYRMLGSVADAEDAVQECFIRWMRVDHGTVREPAAFLRRTVTRLCLDQLKSARARREVYVGPWLPEPLVEDEAADDVTLPLLLALERLSPLERAAFLLHDIFDLDFDEISEALGRDPAACRQLASRARFHVRNARPRYRLERKRGLDIAAAFFSASRNGDISSLREILTEDVSVHADGGGQRRAATRPVRGVEHVLKYHRGLARLYAGGGSELVRLCFVNGLPGFITLESDGEFQTTALEIEQDKIKAIYVVRNPEKLRHLH